MRVETLGWHDYDSLRSCTFCGGMGLMSDETDNCPHFIAAFEDGVWARDIYPPVCPTGFRFFSSMEKMLGESEDVICKKTPRTGRHPAIRAYYVPNPAFAEWVRNLFAKPISKGEPCGQCGLKEVVDDNICYYCGS